MKDANNNNSPCGFSADFTGYLYGEVEAVENARIASHFESCHACADEMTGMSAARSAIAEWRDMEFANLPAPDISVGRAHQSTETEGSSSWFAAWMRPLLGPAFASAVAVALVAVGIWFYGILARQDIASVPTAPETVVSKSAEPLSDPVEPVQPSARQNVVNIAEENDSQGKFRRSEQTISAKPRKDQRSVERRVQTARQPASRSYASSRTAVLQLGNVTAEEADETLKLAELFAEIDAS